jgi:hypothetical protein
MTSSAATTPVRNRYAMATSVATPSPQQSHAKSQATASTKEDSAMEVILVGHGGAADTHVWVKMAHLAAREAEMLQAAAQFQISPARWTSSLLHRHYYELGEDQLRLDPERDCVARNYSYAMQWEDWMTNLVVQYYETGRLQIPDACQGYDLLLLLEYFGILYAPEQLVFCSYAAYQRVRAWSDYLTLRTTLAEHVVHLVQMVPTRSLKTYQLGTVETCQEKLAFLPQAHRSTDYQSVYAWGCDVKDMISQSLTAPQSLPESRTIYNLFNTTKENKVAEALRDDFCVYLQNVLPATADVTFSVKMLQVQPSATQDVFRGKRAVLKVTMEPCRMPSVLSLAFPVDEISTNFQRKESGVLPPPPAVPPATSTPAQADHVYYELAAVATPPPVRKPVKFLPQRSLDPVMAGGTENFPVAIVDSGEAGTVSSALTGPFALESDTEEEDVRAEAVRHEWVQGSLLNRDIDDRMKELLDEDQKLAHATRHAAPVTEEFTDTTTASGVKGRRSPGTPETAPTEASHTPTFTPQVNKGCGTWEWFNIMCTSFLDPSTPLPTRTDQKDKAVAAPITPNPAEELAAAKLVARPAVVQAPASPIKATAKRDVVVLESQEVESSYGISPKIDTHEGVKQRLAALRRQAERDNQPIPTDMEKKSTTEKKKSTTEKKNSTIEKQVVAEEAAPKVKKAKPGAASPLKKAFFRKKTVRVVTQKSPRRQARATSATPQAKKSGLMKLFRRGDV